jgi:hypothetical protein
MTLLRNGSFRFRAGVVLFAIATWGFKLDEQTMRDLVEAFVQMVEIRIKGRIDEHWSDWFGGLDIRHTEKDETILTGEVVDQTALYGLLAKLRDLGLALVSVRQVESTHQEKT